MPTKQIRQHIGYSTDKSRYSFSVGFDQADAKRRARRILDVWETAEAAWKQNNPEAPRRFLWSDAPQAFDLAKQLAKGQTVIPVAHDPERGNYLGRINQLQRSFPTVAFVASDNEAFQRGTEVAEAYLKRELEQLKVMGVVPQNRKSLIQANGTLHQQLDRRIEAIEKDYFDPTTGHITDWAKGKQKMLRRVKEHVADVELSELDLPKLDEIIGTFRNRPVSHRTERPLDNTTCQDTITELKQFFIWLDTLSGCGWELPQKFAYIKTRVREIEEEQAAKEPEIFTIEELAILNQHATPTERVFLLLGLNAAYGADQSGRLRIGEVQLEANPPCLRRVRKKSGIVGKHLLWKATTEAIKWALAKHPNSSDEKAFLLLNAAGKSYWRKTKTGNRCQDVPNMWGRLLDRVQKSRPDFQRRPFNTVRDTSANFIRQIEGEEIAQLQLSHKHQSADTNMRRYTKPPRERHFEALQQLEAKLQSVFEAATKPWEKPTKIYKPLALDAQMVELAEAGLSPYKIAAKLGMNHMTVRRHLKRMKAKA